MAKKRMTSLDVIDTDVFLDMPVSSQNLYFHLNARADDDGFVANPKKIMRAIGAQEDDMKVIVSKRFIITFKDGVCVIKHWRINNFIRKDIYKETRYLDNKKTLFIRRNGAYTLTDDGNAMPVPEGHFKIEDVHVNVALTERQPSIDKVSIDKNSIEKKSIKYLSQIPQDDVDYFVKRFDMSEKQLKDKAESLKLYCESKGRLYKNYRSFLLNAVRKDFKERKPEKKVVPVKEIPLTDKQRKVIEEKKAEITKTFGKRVNTGYVGSG